MEQESHDTIMNAILNVKGDIGELKGTVTGIVTQMTVANGRTAKLESRVDSLERSREQSRGIKASWREIIGFITGVGGVLVAGLALWFRK